MADKEPTPAADKKAEAPSPAGGKTTAELAKLADGLRTRVDVFGKTLAGVATLGTGAVGLAKVGDLAPLDGPWDYIWVAVALGSLLAAAGAAIGIAVRLMQANRPVVFDADLEISEPEGPGLADAKKIFQDAAQRFGFTSLLGLQERERSLRRAAARATTDDERTRRTALANDAGDEIEHALARARLAVVRHNAAEAVSGRAATVSYVVVAVGLLAFAVFADVVTSDRTDAVATAKACADAREAGATADDLAGTACEAAAKKEKPPETPTAGEARADLAAALVVVLQSCSKLQADFRADDAEERPLGDAECDAIAAAIGTLLHPDE